MTTKRINKTSSKIKATHSTNDSIPSNELNNNVEVDSTVNSSTLNNINGPNTTSTSITENQPVITIPDNSGKQHKQPKTDAEIAKMPDRAHKVPKFEGSIGLEMAWLTDLRLRMGDHFSESYHVTRKMMEGTDFIPTPGLDTQMYHDFMEMTMGRHRYIMDMDNEEESGKKCWENLDKFARRMRYQRLGQFITSILDMGKNKSKFMDWSDLASESLKTLKQV